MDFHNNDARNLIMMCIEHLYFMVTHKGTGHNAHVTIQVTAKDGGFITDENKVILRDSAESFFVGRIEKTLIQPDIWKDAMPGFVNTILDTCDGLELVCSSVIVDPGHGWKIEMLP